MVQNSDIPYSFTFQWFHSSSRIHLFTLNNYVVIRHADTNSHSSTYFLVTNIFIRIQGHMISIQHLLFSFNILLICKIHKFRIPSLWTINFFSRIYLFTSATYIQLHSMTKLLFNSFNINFYAHPSLRIIWSQAPGSGLYIYHLETGDPPWWFGEPRKASFSLSKLKALNGGAQIDYE